MKSDMEYVPKGWIGLEIDGVYVNDNQLVVFGSPEENSDHNCDAMGCSSINHVLVRCSIPEWQAVQLRVQPTPPTEPQNFCNPVNGVHASWCTGHNTAGG